MKFGKGFADWFLMFSHRTNVKWVNELAIYSYCETFVLLNPPFFQLTSM